MATSYVVFCGLCVTVLKELNKNVLEPYMDEPFHIPQAQAYCNGEFSTWDPKITTPPGLYLMSLALKKVFMFKCNLAMLRLTTTLTLLAAPIVLTRLLCYHQRLRPPTSLLAPSTEATILSFFPILWFYGFLYYTEVPSLVLIAWTVVAASEDRHWQAALLGLLSCTFRQTNVVWVLYAFASSQVMFLRFRHPTPNSGRLHDPPALIAGPVDVIRSLLSLPSVIGEVLPSFVPYTFVLALFGSFVVWNGGIVLGDKSNHIPTLHVPQLYYFAAFSTFFGWPVLLGSAQGPQGFFRQLQERMFGSKIRTLVTASLIAVMCITINFFTIHHPFLLSDNRHYTFYVWRRIYLLHAAVPYILAPVYIACIWAWFLRVGHQQTMLQTLLVPLLAAFTLLPTPLLEPRYFLVPYILLRAQVIDIPNWALILEAGWYTVINIVTMIVFIYFPRGDIRFMW